MRTRIRLLTSILLLAVLAWAGGDPWRTKPYTEWTKFDTDAILSDSPWAKPVRVISSWEQPQVSNVENQPTFNRSVANATTGKRQEDKVRVEDFRGVMFFIIWNSAKTARQASVRSALLSGQITPETGDQILAQQPEGYEVQISGKDMRPFALIDENELMQNTYLQPKKLGAKLGPLRVRFLRNIEGTEVQTATFVFPKQDLAGKPTITADETKVDFSCKIGKTTLKATFEPRKMIGRDGQDL